MNLFGKVSKSSRKTLLIYVLIIYIIWIFYQIMYDVFYLLLNIEYLLVIGLIIFNPRGTKLLLLLIWLFLLGLVVMDIFIARSGYPIYFILKPLIELIKFLNDGLYYFLIHFVLYAWFIFLTVKNQIKNKQ